MSPPRSFDVVAGRVADLAPVFREPLDSPYEISNALYEALRHVLHDVGGQPDLPVPFTEKIEEQWEMTPTSRANASAARRVEPRGTPPGRERPRHPRHHDRCGTTTSGLDGIRTSVRGKGQRVSSPPYEVLLETVDPNRNARRHSPNWNAHPIPGSPASRRRANACPGVARWTTWSGATPRTSWARRPTARFLYMPDRLS